MVGSGGAPDDEACAAGQRLPRGRDQRHRRLDDHVRRQRGDPRAGGGDRRRLRPDQRHRLVRLHTRHHGRRDGHPGGRGRRAAGHRRCGSRRLVRTVGRPVVRRPHLGDLQRRRGPGHLLVPGELPRLAGAPTTCRPAATGPPRARTARGSSVSASARPRPRPRRTTRSRTRTCSSANRCTASASGRRSAWSWGSGHRSRCAPTPAATSGSRARSWWRSPDPASSRGRGGCRSSGRGDPQEPVLPPDGSLPRHRDRRTQRRAHAEHDTRDVDPRRQAEQADEVASRG
jgi:hypothetical protein